MDRNTDHDELTRDFISMTGASVEKATEYLSASNWDHNIAVQSYYADIDDGESLNDNSGGGASSSTVPPDYTGPRTLDGRPVPQAIPTTSTASSSSKRPQKKTGLATLSSLGSSHASGHSDAHPRDDHGPNRDTYAGGEKSGLAVQDPSQRADPRRIINDLLSRAKSEHQRPPPSSPAGPSSSSSFRGTGQTLGGEGVESRVIPDTSARAPRAPPENTQVQERTLHLWRDGFSIDDGPLHRFDDPSNAEDLRMIQLGRAPVHLMNVRYDDPLDVKLEQHDENFRQLPKVYRPFGGEGRRLGSPVPGETVPASLSTTVATTSSDAGAATSATSSAQVDESQPTVMIRIQMPDGARLPARFNTSQTVNDIYEFISRASPDLQSGGWVLATTFPNKEHTDKSLVIGDMAEFKRGGTAVVKKI
ncbi:hypothetical protein GGS21DRAFT_125918 [Xylaria nigripes]|nr:hypothetical protein GGS21DRAFT_125918 [Xylaria nigripes]